MGRASRCLRSLFNKSTTNCKPKWITTLLKSCKDINRSGAANHSVVAVAIAKGGTNESAAVASKAAVEAVRITRNGPLDFDLESRAAVRIQSVFRGYLARKALRALRALVKLQALVRGYIVRKRAVDQVRRMHALIRAQARARAIRAPVPASSYSSSRTSHSCILDPPTSEDYEYTAQVRKSFPDTIKQGSGRAFSKRFDEGKIVEVDSTVKPYNSSKNKNLFLLSDYCRQNAYQTPPPIPYPSEDLYLQYSNEIDRYSFYAADDFIPPSHTGSFRSTSARRGGHYAPADVNYSESFLSGYPDHPNYMAYTKSSKAKMRSLSAPKQRTQLERFTSQKCYPSPDYSSRRLSDSGGLIK